jgi:transcriptional regulator with XRE-family HTH domain
MDLRTLRKLLGLRLIDVSRATGVTTGKLSEAERGLSELNDSERTAVANFLADRAGLSVRECDRFSPANPVNAEACDRECTTFARRFPSGAEEQATKRGADDLMDLCRYALRNRPRALRNCYFFYRALCLRLYAYLRRQP